MKKDWIDISTLHGDCAKVRAKSYYFCITSNTLWSTVMDPIGNRMVGRRETPRSPVVYNLTLSDEWREKENRRLITISHVEIQAQASRTATLDVLSKSETKETPTMKLLNMIVSATVAADSVEALVKDAIEKETGREVLTIKPIIRESSHFMDRGTYTTFGGYDVTFKS